MKQRFGKLDIHAREVIRGAGLAFLLRGLGAGLAFLLNVAIGRLLGAEGAGLYFLALTVTTIMAVIARLGLDNTLLRFIAAGSATGDWGQVKGVFAAGMRYAALSGLVLSLLVLATAPLIASRVFSVPELTMPLRVMSIAVFTMAMLMLLAESLKGLKRIRDSMLVSGAIYPAVALAMIYPLATTLGPTGAALSYVIGTMAATLFGALTWHLLTRNQPSRTPIDQGVLWASARPMWSMAIINQAVLPWAPLFMLGIWGTVEDSGIFGAATRVATLVSFILVAVNTVIAPKFAELHSRGDLVAIGKLARRFALLVTLAASPVLLLLIFAGDQVMSLFGPDFVQGGTALAILAIGQAVNTLTGSVGYLLLMTGHERDIRNASLLAMLLMFLCALSLIPTFGLIGAAIASAIAVASMNLMNAAQVYIRHKIIVIPFLKQE